jgi:zinc transporter ZupT
MAGGPEAEGAPPSLTELELAAIGAYLPALRRSVAGQRILYWSLGIGFVVGLAAHVGGYALKSSATTGAPGLLTDLLYALGYALWTGVVLVVFVQLVPEAKRRQIMRGLDAYEAALRDKASAASDQASGDDGAPTAG